ncbi:MAG: restriction endonuclease subunit S [Candidatus Methanoperedens sp.]
MTEIGEMPQGWRVVRLGDASLNITDGSHFSPKETKNGNYRIGTVANMTENQIDIDSCKKISKEDYEMLVKNGCKPKIGDVLFSKDGTVGLSFAFKQNDDIVLLSSIAIISPKESLYPDYCACVLKSPLVFKQIEGSKRGTGLKRIILHDLKRFQIPLPPLPEQRRIAEVLGTVDSAIQKVGGAIESTERLKKGLMQRLLTGGIGHERFKESEVGRVPEEWEVVKLNDVCQQIIDCPHSTPKFVDNGPLVVRNFNIRDGRFSLHESYYTTEEEYIDRIKRCIPSEGDILFSREAPIGEACLVPPRLRLCLGQRTMLIRTIPTILFAQFQVYSFYSNLVRPRLFRKGGGATAHHLNVAEVKKLEIPLPPLPEQRRIAEILSVVDRKLELERRRKEKLERVKKGLMNELLTGRKRVKNNF